MKILVTGGAGFIGSHLVDRLEREKHEVFIVDDLSGGSTLNIRNKNNFNLIDCRNASLIDKCIKRIKPEIIFHLAANASENKAQFSPIEVTSRNWNAFINTLTPFIKYGGKRFVFTSSIAVYGALQTPFKETEKCEPEDLYGITELAAEDALKIMSKVHGFEYVIARPHNVYGPRQNMKDPYRNVIALWMNAILREEPWYIYGSGEQKRCFSYIDDVVEALFKCGFKNVSGMAFNIGSDKAYTLNQLAKKLHPPYPAKYLPERLQEVFEAISDHSQAKKYLGYKDTVSLSKGLKKMWTWAKKHGSQEPTFTKLEIGLDIAPINWRKQ